MHNLSYLNIKFLSRVLSLKSVIQKKYNTSNKKNFIFKYWIFLQVVMITKLLI